MLKCCELPTNASVFYSSAIMISCGGGGATGVGVFARGGGMAGGGRLACGGGFAAGIGVLAGCGALACIAGPEVAPRGR